MSQDRDLADKELAELQLSRRLRDAAHRALMRQPPNRQNEPKPPEKDDKDGNE